MAHSLSITDGTTTIALAQANGYQITNEAMGTDENAATRADLHDPEIDSSFDMLLLAAAGSMQTLARNVERMLVIAKRRQSKPEGTRIYLLLQVHGEASPWRAEIVDGRFKPINPLVNWFSNAVPFRLLVTHRAWEGPRVEVALTSAGSSTPATGGKPIEQKLGRNWLQVAGNTIGGSLPAFAELQLTNTSGAEIDFRNYYFGLNNFGGTGGFMPMIEGEDRISGFGTPTADSGSSNGNYNAYSYTNTGYIQWDISTHMDKTEGRTLKLLARFFAVQGTNLHVWPHIRDVEGIIELAKTPEEVYIPISDSRIWDLGSLPFPPGGFNPNASGTILEMKLRATGAATAHFDYIHPMPLDSYQYIVQRGYGIPNNDTVIFDNIEQLYYHNNYSIFNVREGRLVVFPSTDFQRIYVLVDEGSYSNVNRTFTAKLFVRERRLTV